MNTATKLHPLTNAYAPEKNHKMKRWTAARQQMPGQVVDGTFETPAVEVLGATKIFGKSEAAALGLIVDGVPSDEITRQTRAKVAVRDVSFSVEAGECFVIMGLSGSGKSTTVRLLNRLIDPSAGVIKIAGTNVAELDARGLREIRNRRIAMVFQHFALMPHRTVQQNVELGLRIRGTSIQERNEKCVKAIAEVGLESSADLMPSQLSGGMRQRVGIARALATEADILLMDEPFSALDPLIRADMQQLLIKLQSQLHKTIVFITHDLNEAVKLGDRIMMMSDGSVIQLGTPAEILLRPANEFVARFVSEVDRSGVLRAKDVMDSRVGRTIDSAQLIDVRDQLRNERLAGVYVVDQTGDVQGVLTQSDVEQGLREGKDQISGMILAESSRLVVSDCLVADLIPRLDRTQVPLGVVGPTGQLMGVLTPDSILHALFTTGLK